MRRISPLAWVIVFVGLLLASIGVVYYMQSTGMAAGARSLRALSQTAVAGWVLFGLYRWRETPIVRKAAALIIGTVVAYLCHLFFLTFEMHNAAVITVGVYLMAVGFFIGLQVIRVLLSGGWPVMGVARTVLDEAIRMKVPLVLIILLLLLVPALPFVINQEDFLKYRIQSFLSWSMMVVAALLGLMTIFLSVGTITSELAHRQVYLTMSKPVSRLQYLAGKWIGIMALNLLLVAVSGGAIYLFTMMLSSQPGRDAYDKFAVEQQVLVARAGRNPTTGQPGLLQEQFSVRLARLREMDPVTYGEAGAPISSELREQLQKEVLNQWFAIGPLETQTYVFNNLQRAKELRQSLQLRIKPKASRETADGMISLLFRVNGRPFYVPRLADNNYHVIDIPADMVDDNGQLTIQVGNPGVGEDMYQGQPVPQTTITFNTKDGIEVLYRVGGFTGNLARAMTMLWVRLAFLTTLGLAAGTFLGFPVACLTCLLIGLTAVGSSYLAESLRFYAAFPNPEQPLWDRIIGVPILIWDKLQAGEPYTAFKIVIRLIGSAFMMIVPAFGQYNPTPLLSEGRLVSPGMLGQAVLRIGGLWTGGVALIALLIFRQRELARVTV